jgi:hypothetical protein
MNGDFSADAAVSREPTGALDARSDRHPVTRRTGCSETRDNQFNPSTRRCCVDSAPANQPSTACSSVGVIHRAIGSPIGFLRSFAGAGSGAVFGAALVRQTRDFKSMASHPPVLLDGHSSRRHRLTLRQLLASIRSGAKRRSLYGAGPKHSAVCLSSPVVVLIRECVRGHGYTSLACSRGGRLIAAWWTASPGSSRTAPADESSPCD